MVKIYMQVEMRMILIYRKIFMLQDMNISNKQVMLQELKLLKFLQEEEMTILT